jgi:hypothetical protein
LFFLCGRHFCTHIFIHRNPHFFTWFEHVIKLASLAAKACAMGFIGASALSVFRSVNRPQTMRPHAWVGCSLKSVPDPLHQHGGDSNLNWQHRLKLMVGRALEIRYLGNVIAICCLAASHLNAPIR